MADNTNTTTAKIVKRLALNAARNPYIHITGRGSLQQTHTDAKAQGLKFNAENQAVNFPLQATEADAKTLEKR